MGMRFSAVAVPASEIERVAADPDEAFDLFPYDGRPGTVDLDKAWDGLNYLLGVRNEELPLGLAIHGGDILGDVAEEDYESGPFPSYLTADRVAVVAEHLAELTRDQLAARFDPAAMDADRVYPEIWVREGADGLEWLLASFDRLRDFYRDAAAGGLCVVKIVS